MTRYTSTNKYAALKIYAHDLIAEDNTDNEIAIYKHLNIAGDSDHPGKKYVRTIQDSFFVTSRAGYSHQCLVHEVLSNDILSLRYTRPDRKLPEAILKQILIHLLLALDFLHSECHIIHTGQVVSLTVLSESLISARYKRREYLARIGRFVYRRAAGHKRNRGIESLQKYQWV